MLSLDTGLPIPAPPVKPDPFVRVFHVDPTPSVLWIRESFNDLSPNFLALTLSLSLEKLLSFGVGKIWSFGWFSSL